MPFIYLAPFPLSLEFFMIYYLFVFFSFSRVSFLLSRPFFLARHTHPCVAITSKEYKRRHWIYTRLVCLSISLGHQFHLFTSQHSRWLTQQETAALKNERNSQRLVAILTVGAGGAAFVLDFECTPRRPALHCTHTKSITQAQLKALKILWDPVSSGSKWREHSERVRQERILTRWNLSSVLKSSSGCWIL